MAKKACLRLAPREREGCHPLATSAILQPASRWQANGLRGGDAADGGVRRVSAADHQVQDPTDWHSSQTRDGLNRVGVQNPVVDQAIEDGPRKSRSSCAQGCLPPHGSAPQSGPAGQFRIRDKVTSRSEPSHTGSGSWHVLSPGAMQRRAPGNRQRTELIDCSERTCSALSRRSHSRSRTRA